MFAISRYPIKTQLLMLTGVFGLGFVVFGAIAFLTLNAVKVNGPYYAQVVENKDLLADVLPPPNYIVETYLTTHLMPDAGSAEELDRLIAQIGTLKKDFQSRQKHWQNTLQTGPLKDEIGEHSRLPAEAFFAVVEQEMIPALKKKDAEAARAILDNKLAPLYAKHRASVDRIVAMSTKNAEETEASVAGIISSRQWTMGLIGLVLWLVVCGFTVWLRVQAARRERAEEMVSQEKNKATSMLEQAPINVMFADREFKIRYLNASSVKTLRSIERLLPVRVDEILGQTIDVFHKRPEHQRKIVGDAKNLPHRALIKLGDETLDLLVSPVLDDKQQFIGTMVTWEVVTQKLAMEQQIKDGAEKERVQAEEMRDQVAQILEVATLVGRGDYSKHITVTGKSGMGQLGEGLAKIFREKQATEAKDRERQEQECLRAEELQHKVTQILASVNLLATGDFSREIPDLGNDGVGQIATSLNRAVSSVRKTLTEVRHVAGTVRSAAEQLSAASEEISSGAQEQASSLEETAASLEEITATIKQNTDSAQQARQLADGSKEVAEKGGAVVGTAVDAMAAINQSSKKIAEIITAIDEIAFQTNLLALNAAVEAARAGEQGRGFAVVAAEVRNLAQRSATAAKEIKSLIQDSVRKVDHGTDLVNRSGQTLNEIVTSVKRVTDIVTEIAAASREQTTGVDQVNKAVAQMDKVTQTNASQTEELSGTAQSLLGHAEQLQQMVGQFILGNESAAPPSPSQFRPIERHATPRKSADRSRPVRRALAVSTNGHASKRHELDELDDPSHDGYQEF